jgi:transcriptional regulator with XRE-family HTH domain
MSDQAVAARARHAFAIRLRDLRKDAGLTGRELAALSGLHNTKISRIEHAQQTPSEDDIRAWCIACGVARQIPELIAASREVEQMWTEHRREMRAGMVHIQSRSTPLYESTRLLRAYESNVVPGILQTRGYVVAALETSARVHGLPLEDVEEAADARLSRQYLVTEPTGDNTYSFVIEVGALEHGFGGDAVMHEQLDFLLRVTGLPNVAFGIIPPLSSRAIRPGEGFYIFDEQLVRSEMWSGGFRTRRPDQIAYFVRIFHMLRELAVYGAAARELIETARGYLQTRENS